MKILGIDPGMAIVGYGLVEYDGESCTLLKSGSIQTKKNTRESSRLLEIMQDIETIIDTFKPDVASIEKLFFFRKQVLTGYGRAEKKEVEQMVKISLGTDTLPKLDDTVDAIAIAICHSRSCL